MRHVFSLAGNYELPFGKERKYGSDWGSAKNIALGGWNLNTIFQTHTGVADHRLRRGRTVAAGDALAGAAQPRSATARSRAPASTTRGSTSPASSTPRRDSSAIPASASCCGPGYWNVDFGLAKHFYIDNTRYVTFRVEAFNVFNHPNFALQAGSADMSNPTTFGRIQNTFSAPRIVELVVKFTY